MANLPSPCILARSFRRSDEILYLVENASVLTLAWHRRVRGVTLTATLRHPASLRPSLHIHVQSFGRFDEILYLVEKAPDLTLPDSPLKRARVRCHIRVAISARLPPHRFAVSRSENLESSMSATCPVRPVANVRFQSSEPSTND
jgi:hypothetical protein